MTYSVGNLEIERIAEELGLKVSFNSPKPGVLNTTTQEHKDLEEYFEDFFHDGESEELVEVEALREVKLSIKRPKKNEGNLKEFLYFGDYSYPWAG